MLWCLEGEEIHLIHSHKEDEVAQTREGTGKVTDHSSRSMDKLH